MIESDPLQRPRVCAYVRIDSFGQVDQAGQSAHQQHQIAEYAARNDYKMACVYVEGSGSGVTSARPELQRMMANACDGSHRFDAIIVASHSRISRDIAEFAGFRRSLEIAGVQLLSVDQDAA